jgi:hypothetical protein
MTFLKHFCCKRLAGKEVAVMVTGIKSIGHFVRIYKIFLNVDPVVVPVDLIPTGQSLVLKNLL